MAYLTGTRERKFSGGTMRLRMAEDSVKNLQHQLLLSKAETQKVTDQLNCLIDLIKRSWAGDYKASMHISKIVGVLPPQQRSHSPEPRAKTSRSRAMNNWVLLTIGLLNKYYKRIENKLTERQYMHMLNRQAYFEEQLMLERNLRSRLTLTKATDLQLTEERYGPLFASVSQPAAPKSSPTQSGAVPTQKPSSPAEDVTKPIYRSSFRDDISRYDVTVGSLLEATGGTEQVNVQENYASNGKRQPVLIVNDKRRPPGGRRDVTNGSNPRRYGQTGLYEPSGALQKQARGRPVSAVTLRENDAKRSRPRSSVLTEVVIEGETGRPLKYESTRPASRPVSAPVKTRPRRVTSAKRDKVVGQGQGQSSAPNAQAFVSRAPVYVTEKVLGDAQLEDLEEEDTARAQRHIEKQVEQQAMRVRIAPPPCLADFERSLNDQNDLESDFRKTTLMLQKKLGISEEGRI